MSIISISHQSSSPDQKNSQSQNSSELNDRKSSSLSDLQSLGFQTSKIESSPQKETENDDDLLEKPSGRAIFDSQRQHHNLNDSNPNGLLIVDKTRTEQPKESALDISVGDVAMPTYALSSHRSVITPMDDHNCFEPLDQNNLFFKKNAINQIAYQDSTNHQPDQQNHYHQSKLTLTSLLKFMSAKNTLNSLVQFLSLKDVTNIRSLCQVSLSLIKPEVQAQAIRFGNVDDELRLPLWNLLLPFHNSEMQELVSKFSDVSANPDDLMQVIITQADQTVPESIRKQIQLDLKRTRDPATGAELSGQHKKDLTDVLQSIAVVFPLMGYCQGMNYIAAVIYSQLLNPDQTLQIFISLIAQKGLRGLFNNSVPEFHLRSYVIQVLFKEYLPDFFNLITKRLQLQPNAFVCDWIMTLFCGYFQQIDMNGKLAVKILDGFILDGWVGIYRIGLAILWFIWRDLDRDIQSCGIDGVNIGTVLKMMEEFKTDYGKQKEVLQLADRIEKTFMVNVDFEELELGYFKSLVVQQLEQKEFKDPIEQKLLKLLHGIKEILE